MWIFAHRHDRFVVEKGANCLEVVSTESVEVVATDAVKVTTTFSDLGQVIGVGDEDTLVGGFRQADKGR